MSKSILVLDTPKNCGKCPISVACGDSVFLPGEYLCPINDRMVSPEEKPNWCPLKPMPEKIDVPDFDHSIKAKNENAEEVGAYMYDRGHYRGYNICIDNILGQ